MKSASATKPRTAVHQGKKMSVERKADTGESKRKVNFRFVRQQDRAGRTWTPAPRRPRLIHARDFYAGSGMVLNGSPSQLIVNNAGEFALRFGTVHKNSINEESRRAIHTSIAAF